MKIPTKTRYGMRLMLALALRYGEGTVFLKDIAKQEDISEKYLSLIIIPLKSAGLVKSTRGAHGGYMLGKDPMKITLDNIFMVMEGNQALVDCIKTPTLCNRALSCITKIVWEKVEDALHGVLNSMTLADLIMMHRTRQDVVSYNI